MAGQAFEKHKRLLRYAEFRKIYDGGHKKQTPWFSVHWVCAMDAEPTRFGISVSRKTGNAVQRNAVKRRLREFIRTYPQPWPRGRCIVLASKGPWPPSQHENVKNYLYSILNEIFK